MPANDVSRDVVLEELRAMGRAERISGIGRLSGGTMADVWLITYADGSQVVGKTATGAPPDLFAAEADGLAALHGTGHLAAPQVLAVTGRLLRYLSEPAVEQALTTADRLAIERLCSRLPELIPAMPAVLTHGDLWAGNLASQTSGRITVIDPAVSCAWAEVDLSMLWCEPRPAASSRFFEIYQELNPSPAGWADRMPILHLRELLSVIAAYGPAAAQRISQARDILAPFYPR